MRSTNADRLPERNYQIETSQLFNFSNNTSNKYIGLKSPLLVVYLLLNIGEQS